MPVSALTIDPVASKADRKAFVDFAWTVYKDDPYWTPPLKDEVRGLIDPKKNPWFGHGRAALFLARRNGEVVGRISAQVDDLVLEHMQAGLGQWGFFDALDEDAALALIARAEDWLRGEGMTRAMGPISLSIWDEPGLLIKGFADKPVVMMGHHLPHYAGWIEKAGYAKAKDLVTYEVPTSIDYPPAINRLLEIGEKNPRIRLRDVDKSNFDAEAQTILTILNDAWADNWGYVPLTPAEIAYAGKKLKPIIYEDLVQIAEYDGEPVAFILTIPDINEMTDDLDGRLFPFGFAKLLWRLHKPRVKRVRVPLMGVLRKLHGSRLAGQLAFLLIERVRKASRDHYGVQRGEFGWILEDNEGMMSIAQLPGADTNHVYRIYDKAL
ncbi:N-acetyltransferase [Sphingomonas rhizophila]|uniref:N-acetyltransferase n=1 Tax=Sphingomonas rhizophila TaxID=2071607 RepID=A0A7G9SBI5_9SPHN|nr:N-acetyltransferase [Sphingomonas rhizophila]QNN65210.1 N-acetyltransferase [Sphingomonas rhizophila]